jgi:hypothetical protein
MDAKTVAHELALRTPSKVIMIDHPSCSGISQMHHEDK